MEADTQQRMGSSCAESMRNRRTCPYMLGTTIAEWQRVAADGDWRLHIYGCAVHAEIVMPQRDVRTDNCRHVCESYECAVNRYLSECGRVSQPSTVS
jgi:hypothetical protein